VENVRGRSKFRICVIGIVADPDPSDPYVWSSWIRIRLPEVRIRIVLSSNKNSKKTLDSYWLGLLFNFIFEK
jgi:hypothetical protein